MIEILISASLLGIVSTALATLSSSITPVSRVTFDNLTTARDLGRIQDLVPVDLSRYPLIDLSPNALAHLPGTNVFTLHFEEAEAPPTDTTVRFASYRYVEVEGAWHLVRFELADESTPLTQAIRTTVSSRLQEPPTSWQTGTSPSHAVTVLRSTNTQVDERWVDIHFSTGFHTTAAGQYRHLVDAPSPIDAPLVDPVPTVRCGGSITIVVNTSTSIWNLGAAATVTTSLAKFVDSLRGTPTYLRVIAFERSGYSFFPDIAIGTYVDMIGAPASITTLLSRLGTLSTTSTSWRNGRNWEDGLWQATRRETGTILAQVPDLIIFITDGSPNRNRSNTTSDTDTTFHEADLTRAITAAEYARGTGATLMGVLLGSGADSTAVGHMTSVFGSMTWDGTMNISPLDRARHFARPSGEGFSRLEDILGLINSWSCAGTITLQQRVLVAGVTSAPTDAWEFDVSTSNPTLTHRAVVQPSQPTWTVDLGAEGSAQTRSITVSQSPRAGHRHHSVSCTSAGVGLTVQTVVDPNGSTSVIVPAPPRSAVACTFTSEVVP